MALKSHSRIPVMKLLKNDTGGEMLGSLECDGDVNSRSVRGGSHFASAEVAIGTSTGRKHDLSTRQESGIFKRHELKDRYQKGPYRRVPKLAPIMNHGLPRSRRCMCCARLGSCLMLSRNRISNISRFRDQRRRLRGSSRSCTL